MIPILYEKDETVFTNNGLGRLRDCILCTVTEERNGIYECDFEYPITGANYDLIQLGRIIAVTHDDTGNVQPFDIVSSSKPINGIVTFHAVHISYRQSYMTMSGGSVNDLATALSTCKHGTNLGNDGNPFDYWTDMLKSGYCAAIGLIPKTVRSVLGGVEGSILDTYGGEYEWDRWTVKLWSARGQARDFSIRYGVNMLDYNEDVDTQGNYSSCIPYWTDGTNTVVAGVVNSNVATITGRGECVPLDLSDKFETQPTTAQLETMAAAYMNSNNTFIPTRSINVEFVRLQDMTEYADFRNLFSCSLCDTIKVIFPEYNSSGSFKIVKTVWDVLSNRYESMELGALSTTLAEALGIESGGESSIPDIFVKKAGDTMTGPLTVEGHSSAIGATLAVSESTVSVPNNTVKNLARIELTAGTWLLIGTGIFAGNATGIRELFFGTSATQAGDGRFSQLVVSAMGTNQIHPQILRLRVITATSETVYLNARQNSGGALNVTYPGIQAVRIA